MLTCTAINAKTAHFCGILSLDGISEPRRPRVYALHPPVLHPHLSPAINYEIVLLLHRKTKRAGRLRDGRKAEWNQEDMRAAASIKDMIRRGMASGINKVGDRMLTFALKLAAAPALLLAAMPVQAVETLSRGLAISAAESPFTSLGAWEARSNLPQGVFSLKELKNGAVIGRLRTRLSPPLPTAAIMPEPMSWAMMIVGLTVVGGSIRLLQRRAGYRISFV